MQTEGKNEGRPVNEALTNCLGREKWLYSHIFSVNDISIKGSKRAVASYETSNVLLTP